MTAVPATVDEYIEGFPPGIQAVLREVRATVRLAAPLAEERISYRMPALFQQGAVVYYGAFKKHLGLFPPVEDAVLLAQVAAYAGPKSNLQFPYAQPMPHALIAAVVQARVRSNVAKAAARARPSRRQPSLEPRNVMTAESQVTGPASYFPSIEKKYGQPIDHWMSVLSQAGDLKHMELVSLLKTVHGLGHGHANALVAWHLGQKKPWPWQPTPAQGARST
ncbi:MAG: DUF4287 domain-containing protein [Burkholderiales bacterium]|jgi:uncharacterized protein YdhG (YjbR/CyaY superfamily)|nr:DUF4287 domain-containing protein [Burkholderiales bacterium]MBP7521745.1 DUF4287 domain-containing protein [Leptothrix sp. (in: b-proteobacteria)]